MSLSPSRPLRVAALVKQIPVVEDMQMGPDGRLIREGQELHMNDYCRRAVAKGTEIARASGGTITVITLGPPSAENVLREALAFGVDQGVHITDPAFGGSDTLATAKALAAALEQLGPFDLVLLGRNSVDADTGQVPPQVAQLVGLPFLTGVRELSLEGETLEARLEHDDEVVTASVTLPAIISCAERLCDPCKIKDPEVWAQQDDSKITTITAATLGDGPWGEAGSPTSVGKTRVLDTPRDRNVLDGPLDDQIDRAVALLTARGALRWDEPDAALSAVPVDTNGAGPVVAVVVEPDRERVTRELLGAAAHLAARFGGSVVAIGPELTDPDSLASWGADAVASLEGSLVEEDLASTVISWARDANPWGILAPGTAWGREVASRVAAGLGAGLTGDAVELDVAAGRLVAWKPAFGGSLVAEILCSSDTQMATVRAGVLPLLEPRRATSPALRTLRVEATSRVKVISRAREDDADEMANAPVVIGVGQGLDPSEYPLLDTYKEQLGAAYCATRKVTDKGWMPRARQVGITGHSISPHLYFAVGLSGKFNHTSGVRSSGTIVAVNPDPNAPIFDSCDVGFVGVWTEVFERLIPRIV